MCVKTLMDLATAMTLQETPLALLLRARTVRWVLARTATAWPKKRVRPKTNLVRSTGGPRPH